MIRKIELSKSQFQSPPRQGHDVLFEQPQVVYVHTFFHRLKPATCDTKIVVQVVYLLTRWQARPTLKLPHQLTKNPPPS